MSVPGVNPGSLKLHTPGKRDSHCQRLSTGLKKFPELKVTQVQKKPAKARADQPQGNGFRLVSVSPEPDASLPQEMREEAGASPPGVTLTRERLTVSIIGTS